MQNVIQRETVINASQKRIYAAITDPKQVVKWFPESVEGDFLPGSQPILGFGEYGKNQLYIVAAEPHEYFAYRWVPGANHFLGDVQSVPNTLVEFRITQESEDSCKVTLTESGFATLSADMMEDAFKQNTGGWEYMMDRLSKLFINTK